jgi:hypothetical protein
MVEQEFTAIFGALGSLDVAIFSFFLAYDTTFDTFAFNNPWPTHPPSGFRAGHRETFRILLLSRVA